jgi:hypothetical protein
MQIRRHLVKEKKERLPFQWLTWIIHILFQLSSFQLTLASRLFHPWVEVNFQIYWALLIPVGSEAFFEDHSQ